MQVKERSQVLVRTRDDSRTSHSLGCTRQIRFNAFDRRIHHASQ